MRLKPYPEYKDSGVKWLGDVPQKWKVNPLKRHFKIVGGSTPKSEQEEYWDGDITWVTPSDLSKLSSFSIKNSQRKITSEGLSSCGSTLVPAGSIVLSTRAPIGSLAFVEEELCTNQGCKSLVPDPETNSMFYTYLLSVSSVELNARGKGTTFLELSSDELSAFKVGFPSLNEQNSIVRFLDRETGKLDNLISKQEYLIKLLQEKRQAVISHAVTKGLNPDAKMKDSGVEWLGMVPAHWDIGGVTKFIGPIVDYRGRTPTKVEEGIFLVTARNIKHGKIDYSASEEYVDVASVESLLERGRPEIGDVLFTMEAPLGQVALIDRVDIALAQRIVKFRGKDNVLLNSYLLRWIMGSYCQAKLETLATGSTALGIKSSKLGEIECLIPPIAEQSNIGTFIDDETSKIDTLIDKAKRSIELAKEHRTALISAAVTGKIDVREVA